KHLRSHLRMGFEHRLSYDANNGFKRLMVMDHAETIAQKLIEHILVGTRMHYRAEQSQGQHDFDLDYQDGRVAAVEVTAAVDREQTEGYAAILDTKKGGSFVPTMLCKQDWWIHPLPSARITKIRRNADEYIAQIEKASIENFWGPTSDDPAVERIYRDLHIES